ncbi:MAG: hypothetical protein K2Y22_06275 [Candidatus Obscuribacterales bacterium]|nr:hypothetical protein [Candidatus Obscuribacterales bacterium]
MPNDKQTQFLVSICKHPDLSLAKAGTYAPTADLPVGTEIITVANRAWPLIDVGCNEVLIDILREKQRQKTPVLLIIQGGEFDYHSFEKLNADKPLTEGHPYLIDASQQIRYERRILRMFELYRQEIREQFLQFDNIIGLILLLKNMGPGIRNDVDTLHVIQREKTKRDILRLKMSTKAMKLDRRLAQHMNRLTNGKFIEKLTKEFKTQHVARLKAEYISVALASRDKDAPPLTEEEEAQLMRDAKKFAESDAARLATDEAVAEAKRLMEEIQTELGEQIAEEFPEHEKEFIAFPDGDFDKLIGFSKSEKVKVLPLGAGIVLNGFKPEDNAVYRGTLFKCIDFNRMIPGQAAIYERRQRGIDVVLNSGGAFSNTYNMTADANSSLAFAQCQAIEVGCNFNRTELRARDYKNIAAGVYVGVVLEGGRIFGQAYNIQPGNDGIMFTVIGPKIFSATKATALCNFKPLPLPLGQTVEIEEDGDACNNEHCHNCEE